LLNTSRLEALFINVGLSCALLGTACGDDKGESTGILLVTDVQVSEADGKAEVVFRREGDLKKSASVVMSTLAETALATKDFEAVTEQTVTFEAEQAEQTVNIPIVNDTQMELNEVFRVALSSPEHITLERDSAVVTINNDDNQLYLAELDPAFGIRIDGSTTTRSLGWVVGHAGDVNGDRRPDILLAGGTTSSERQGVIYVVYGRAKDDPYPAILNVKALDGKNGFAVYGAAETRIGLSASTLSSTVTGVGDVNADGYDDIAFRVSPNASQVVESGRVFVMFGRGQNKPFPAALQMGELQPNDGVFIEGAVAYSYAGDSITSGDVNGDGISDMLIGAPGLGPVTNPPVIGRAYVIFGRGDIGATQPLSLSSLGGEVGMELLGEVEKEFTGVSVIMSDVNGDELDDMIIAAEAAQIASSPFPANKAGKVYVVYGYSDLGKPSTPGSFELSTLNGTNGLVLLGNPALERDAAGRVLKRLGDVTGDGRDEWLVSQRGQISIFYGREKTASPLASPFSLNDFSSHEGMRMIDAQLSTLATDGVGDFNSDGVNDWLVAGVSFKGSDTEKAGAGYIIYGSKVPSFEFGAELSDIDPKKSINFIGSQREWAGVAASGIGDVNGDGHPDVVIGAPQVSSEGTGEGRAYLLWGRPD